jgi:hypothetical protein
LALHCLHERSILNTPKWQLTSSMTERSQSSTLTSRTHVALPGFKGYNAKQERAHGFGRKPPRIPTLYSIAMPEGLQTSTFMTV